MIQVSLGSSVGSISANDQDGFTIAYVDGDICNAATGQKYESYVSYVCDRGEEEDMFYKVPKYQPQMPTLVHDVTEDFGTQCIYHFEWISRYACSQCKSN